MSKLYGTFQIAAKELLAYKFDVLIWGFLNPIIVAVYYFIWKAIYAYSGETVIRGFTFTALIVYFAVMQMVNSFTWSNIDHELANRIRDGYLSPKLMRPISVYVYSIYKKLGELAWVLPGQVVPVGIIAYLFFGMRIASYTSFGFFLVSSALALMLNFTFIFILGISAFWLTKYSGMRMFRSGLMWFFTGAFVPITFFPLALQRALDFLPFKYMMFTPIEIFLGRYGLIGMVQNVAMQVLWLAILLVCLNFAWKAGLKRFSAVGQ
ncbi:MAG: ABC-2 family transporter protein [archaeon]